MKFNPEMRKLPVATCGWRLQVRKKPQREGSTALSFHPAKVLSTCKSDACNLLTGTTAFGIATCMTSTIPAGGSDDSVSLYLRDKPTIWPGIFNLTQAGVKVLGAGM